MPLAEEPSLPSEAMALPEMVELSLPTEPIEAKEATSVPSATLDPSAPSATLTPSSSSAPSLSAPAPPSSEGSIEALRKAEEKPVAAVLETMAVSSVSQEEVGEKVEKAPPKNAPVIASTEGGESSSNIEVGEEKPMEKTEIKKEEKVPPFAIWLGGVAYASKAEIARAYGIAPHVIYNKLKKGWTLEQIVGIEERVEEKISFQGKAYESERELAEAYGVTYLTYRNRISHGWSQEEALGLSVRMQTNPKLEGKTFALSDIATGLRFVLESNIFALLGLPADSSKSQIMTAKDRLEKYCKLGAPKAYKGKVELPNLESLDRDLGRTQVIVASFDELENRWLWFSDARYAANWNRKIVENLKPKKFSYEEFLAGYYQMLITDPLFTEKENWNRVFAVLVNLFSLEEEELYERLAGHLGEEGGKFTKAQIVSSFKKHILRPLKESIRLGDGTYLRQVLPFWNTAKLPFAEEMRDACDEAILEIVTHMMEPLEAVYSSMGENRLSATEQKVLFEAAMTFAMGEDYSTCLSLVEAIDKEDMYHDIVCKKIADPLWECVIKLWYGDNVTDAKKIMSKMFVVGTDAQKKNILQVCTPDDLPDVPKSAFPADVQLQYARKKAKSKNYKEAFEWYLILAKNGNLEAYKALAEFYEMGNGCNRDLKEAYFWYVKAADAGDVTALWKIGKAYLSDDGPYSIDREVALRYWLRAYGENPSPDMLTRLDKEFPNWREHDARDIAQVASRIALEILANAGMVSALYYIGLHYSGENLSQKMMEELGYGEGSEELGLRYLLKAALAEYKPSFSALKKLYGVDVKQAKTGEEMFAQASQYKNDGTEKEKNIRFYWLRRAVNHGYLKACNQLGVCYDDGVGTKVDDEMANALYLQSIEANQDANANYNYGWNLYNGHGVACDFDKAKAYMLKARSLGHQKAGTFLTEHYGNVDGVFNFKDFEQKNIYRQNGLFIDFTGLQDSQEEVALRFEFNGYPGGTAKIIVDNIFLDDAPIESPAEDHTKYDGTQFTPAIKAALPDGQCVLKFRLEGFDSAGKSTFATRTVQLTINRSLKTYAFSLLKWGR